MIAGEHRINKRHKMGTELRSEGVSRTGKLMLLVVLCLQNAVYTMFRRYSVGILGETWSSSSVLMVGEVIKLVISTFMALTDSGPSGTEKVSGMVKLWRLLISSAPMIVPAIIFWVMNLLSYISLERIDASTFTVCAQMKILMTAVFSSIILRRTFHPRKWRALFLLVLGVTLVSNGSYTPEIDSDEKDINIQYIFGVVAVLTEVTLSGFVSVYFEGMLKSKVTNLSVWDRNFQLAVYSIPCYLSSTLKTEGPIFHAWTINAVILAFLGGAGGLLVALTMKHTDAVLKTFATSGAIIVTSVAGYMLLDAPLDIPIGIGGCCTVLSLLNYSDEGGMLRTDAESKAENKELESIASHRASFILPPLQSGANDDNESIKPLMEGNGLKRDSYA